MIRYAENDGLLAPLIPGVSGPTVASPGDALALRGHLGALCGCARDDDARMRYAV